MEWIVTDDIRRETWRRLFEFANIDLAIEAIAARHGTPKNSSEKENYKKQAQQVRVCVLQAKEYFDAAESSSLFTSPNHAYYGAISLASMMMLLLGDGRKALDVLRRDNKNNHHGLGFSTGCDAKRAATGLTLLDETRVEILQQGHFANWYQSLPPTEQTHGLHITASLSSANRSWRPTGQYEIPKLDKLVGKKLAVTDLLKYFPDLSSDLYRARINVARSRVTHQIEMSIPGNSISNVWYLHGAASVTERDAIVSGFEIEPAFVSYMTRNMDDALRGGVIRISWPVAAATPTFHWPSGRDTMNYDTFYYADKVDTPELVDMYLVAYQLSMTARYFPDIWISCIESHCKAAKLIEAVVELIKKKLPILALSAVTPGGVTISTHLEPWKL